MDNLSTSSTPVAELLVQQVSKNWWVLLIRGIMLIIIGGYALSVPGVTLATYCTLLGIFLIIDGIMALIFAVSHKMDSKKWILLRGALSLLLGIFMLAHPLFIGGLVAVTLVLLVAIQSIISGSLEIVVAIRDRKAIQGEGWMMLSGAFSILFGIILFARPVVAAAVFIQVAGVFAILFGIAAIFASFRFKALKA
ncbi:DUF308 domain-containing protein [Kiritimatiellota bacterium B12222]|nr:DUF308 domain-containing protein [Kiritimatiellota bacterium B12222]